MGRITIIVVFFLVMPAASKGQPIANIAALDNLLSSSGKNLVILGEEHTSAANSQIVLAMLQHLHSTQGLSRFVMEFGPSDAYLYNQYLATGDTTLLLHTFYAGKFPGWRAFFGRLRRWQTPLGTTPSIAVSGIDFDRPQTFAAAFEALAKRYNAWPKPLDSLRQHMNTKAFSNAYRNRLPSKADRLFMNSAKRLLANHRAMLAGMLNHKDLCFVDEIIRNPIMGFDGERERGLLQNTRYLLDNLPDSTFLMLIGRGHANYTHQNVAHVLKQQQSGFHMVSGVVVYQNSDLWEKGFKKTKTAQELLSRPWKKHYHQLAGQARGAISLVPLARYSRLKEHADYVIIAQGHNALAW